MNNNNVYQCVKKGKEKYAHRLGLLDFAIGLVDA